MFKSISKPQILETIQRQIFWYLKSGIFHSYDAFKAENFASKTGLYFQREEEKAFLDLSSKYLNN